MLGKTDLSEHLLKKPFMKSVFNLRPPKCRYVFTWSFGKVLSYFTTLYPNRNLSLKLPTLKCVALIALATAQRSQTLVALDLNHLFVMDTSVVFEINYLIKTSKPGHTDFQVKLDKYQNKAICPVTTLKSYIKRTNKMRKSQRLFVSFKTLKAIKSSTISRWLKLVLSQSGIDIQKFKVHSLRGTSQSAACRAGVSLKDILTTANWSSASTFRRFYFRDINVENTTYTSTVFADNT